MQPSQRCIKLVQEFEGCARKRPDGSMEAYPDPGTGGDPWTIGWGSTGPAIKKGVVWTEQQCDDRFVEHLTEFAASVAKAMRHARANQNPLDAMVGFAYNLGAGNLSASTLLKKHKTADFKGAAAEFAKWNKANKKVMAGLTRRRAAEAPLYLKPPAP